MELTLAILAGGKGTRLGGRDKGQLTIAGTQLMDRLLALSPLCTEVSVIDRDVVPDKGAPGGVVTALLNARTEWVLVVCCDMPFVTENAVRDLLSRDGPAFFRSEGGMLEPFPGIYKASWGHRWRERLTTNPSMRELLSQEDVLSVPLTNPQVVRSVNTWEDAKSLGVDIP